MENYNGIEIYHPEHSEINGDVPVMLNWPVMGSVTIEQAESFIANLQSAINHAREL